MRRHQSIFSALLSLLLIAPIYSALAADQLPPPGPEGTWREIWRGKATSNCIGNPISPICAVETHMACYLQWRGDYCHMVGGYDSDIEDSINDDKLYQGLRSVYDPEMDEFVDYNVRYRILDLVSLSKDTSSIVAAIPQSKWKYSWRNATFGPEIRHGDVLVRVVQQSCVLYGDNMEPEDKDCYFVEDEQTAYITRQYPKGRWQIIRAYEDATILDAFRHGKP